MLTFRTDKNLTPVQTGLLILSAILAAAYLGDGFGLALPYPFNVVLKASGIVLLGVIALMRGYWLLALGLFFGSAGDAFLALQPSQIAFGIGAFGIGHIIYIALFTGELRRAPTRGLWGYIAAAGLAIFGAIMLIALQPHFGEMRIPASVYNGIIMLMAILAVMSRAHPLAIAGALLFVISDSVLAWRLFADALPWGGPVVWVTYYLAQAGICLGLSKRS
ncbi:MAG: lysoplasmalogenase [Alphaproteobacteria bacterium]|nr:lysoplasmalogenase [Alphaproteobacteria bacterium]